VNRSKIRSSTYFQRLKKDLFYIRKYSNVLRKGVIMGRWMKKIKNKQYGQAMAEFALTIPVFLLLIFGVIELSRFFLVYSSVYTASREATRFATSVGSGTTKNYLDCEAIANRAVSSGSFGGVQIDDITIFYESSPGTIVASCPDLNEESVPLSGNCHNGSIDCDTNPPAEYEPQLGHRILVDIGTDFESILGIVPDLPIHVENGRTIMMSIVVAKEPEPIDLCDNFVGYDNPTPQEGEENILYVDIENTSEESFFTIHQIMDVDWTVTVDAPKLMEIRWTADENPIWITDIEEGRLPIITIPDAGSVDYWKEHTRNLIPEATYRLEFVFSQPVDQDDIELSFDLVMQNASLPTDFCWPVK